MTRKTARQKSTKSQEYLIILSISTPAAMHVVVACNTLKVVFILMWIVIPYTRHIIMKSCLTICSSLESVVCLQRGATSLTKIIASWP